MSDKIERNESERAMGVFNTIEWLEPDLEAEEIELADGCDFSFLVNVRGAKTLDDALETMALNIGLNGIDSFHILATDPETDRQWIITQGEVYDAADLKREHDAQAHEDEEDDESE